MRGVNSRRDHLSHLSFDREANDLPDVELALVETHLVDPQDRSHRKTMLHRDVINGLTRLDDVRSERNTAGLKKMGGTGNTHGRRACCRKISVPERATSPELGTRNTKYRGA